MTKQKSPEFELMLADLARSGLDAADARRMGVEALTAEQASAFTGVNGLRAGYRLPYFDLDGKPIEFARVRYLPFTGTVPFGGKVDDDAAKYRQPDGSAPEFYLPPFTNWRAVAADPAVELLFTEGEKKSAKATVEKFPTVGLGGVNAFVQKQATGKQGRPKSVPLDDFDAFVWLGRVVIIVYDSDIAWKPQVQDAERKLAALLIKLGAKPYRVRLTCDCKPMCKGLDDFLVKHGADAFKALTREPFDQVEMLNEKYIMLSDPPATVYNRESRKPMNDHKFAVESAQTTTLNLRTGEVVSAAQSWLMSPTRANATRLLYEPAREPETLINDPDFDGKQGYNIWSGLYCEPRKGDIAPYLELLEKAFPDPQQRRLFEQWAAYPLQNLGAKIQHAVLMVNDETGIGKTFLGRIIGGVYGRNYLFLDRPEALHEKFNAIFEGRLFVLADELLRSRLEAERLKSRISESDMSIEHKGINSYNIANRLNIYAASNHIDALKLDNKDRRWWVVEFPNWPKSKSERDAFFKRLGKWWYVSATDKRPRVEAASAMLYHLLSEVDCKSFNPTGDPPMTAAKEEMIELTRTDVESFAAQIKANPKLALGNYYRPVMSAEQIAVAHATKVNAGFTKGEVQRYAVALRKVKVDKIFAKSSDKSEKQEGARLFVLDPDWVEARTLNDIFLWHRADISTLAAVPLNGENDIEVAKRKFQR